MNMKLRFLFHALVLLCLGGGVLANPIHAQDSPPLKICVTVPDLGDLVQAIGASRVHVTVFAKGSEDPHFVEAKPGFVKALSKADAFVQVGMSLEVGWVPVLLQNCRNTKVQPGGEGFIDGASVIQPLQVPTGTVDRSQGDVHPGGNPHYLLDPLNGLAIARLLRDTLSTLHPQDAELFAKNYTTFEKEIYTQLVGPALVEHYAVKDIDKLALLFEHGKLMAYLKSKGEQDKLGGWLGDLTSYTPVNVIADHDMWPYFGRRFGIHVVEFLEPKPGIAPSTKHLANVMQRMQKKSIHYVIQGAYFNPRYAALIADKTGARVVNLAHQVQARKGTATYIQMLDYNIKQLREAFSDE